MLNTNTLSPFSKGFRPKSPTQDSRVPPEGDSLATQAGQHIAEIAIRKFPVGNFQIAIWCKLSERDLEIPVTCEDTQYDYIINQ